MSIRFVDTRGVEIFSLSFEGKRTRRQNQLGYPAEIVSIAMSRFVRGGSAQGGAKEQSTYTLTGLEVNLHAERKLYVSLYSHQKSMVPIDRPCRLPSLELCSNREAVGA